MIFPSADFIRREAREALRAYYAPFSGIVDGLRSFRPIPAAPRQAMPTKTRERDHGVHPAPSSSNATKLGRGNRTGLRIRIRSSAVLPSDAGRGPDGAPLGHGPLPDWESGIVLRGGKGSP